MLNKNLSPKLTELLEIIINLDNLSDYDKEELLEELNIIDNKIKELKKK